MNWTELIHSEIESNYAITQHLIGMVDAAHIDWKPPLGSNWMTVGQLLHHLTDACGAPMRGFVTGDWGIPEGVELAPEDMLPAADKLPAIGSAAEAAAKLAEDKRVALDMLARCKEEQLTTEMVAAPWNPAQQALGYQLLQMTAHLGSHKAQLYYYLKLLGKPVNTGDLWGGG